MKIETKFSLGDAVWYMHNGAPCCAQIERIKIEISQFGGMVIDNRYCLPNDELSECELFETKEDLINRTK